MPIMEMKINAKFINKHKPVLFVNKDVEENSHMMEVLITNLKLKEDKNKNSGLNTLKPLVYLAKEKF